MDPSGKIALFICFNENPKGDSHEPAVLACFWKPLTKVILYLRRVDAGGDIHACVVVAVGESKPFAHIPVDTPLLVPEVAEPIGKHVNPVSMPTLFIVPTVFPREVFLQTSIPPFEMYLACKYILSAEGNYVKIFLGTAKGCGA